ncbi:hypothetical protein PsYK624_012100 [Phanerochaete sordida]|uniref:Uncharacterized protein n=1 Tax=Phanerochaete sordida TaxID=48140 RepID=A0A9P3FXS3_9APHY|nr:hypothetical protein PsYK624_012100 [Phanerochaete sordida]
MDDCERKASRRAIFEKSANGARPRLNPTLGPQELPSPHLVDIEEYSAASWGDIALSVPPALHDHFFGRRESRENRAEHGVENAGGDAGKETRGNEHGCVEAIAIELAPLPSVRKPLRPPSSSPRAKLTEPSLSRIYSEPLHDLPQAMCH